MRSLKLLALAFVVASLGAGCGGGGSGGSDAPAPPLKILFVGNNSDPGGAGVQRSNLRNDPHDSGQRKR